MKQIWTSTEYATKDIRHPSFLNNFPLGDITPQFCWELTGLFSSVYALTEMKRLIHATKMYADFGSW